MNLSPYPSYKSGGIEWFGAVPAHWTVKKLRHLALLKSGESITSEQIEDAGDYPVFGGNGIRGYSTRHTHRGSYVLIGRQGALCGNINYASGLFWASEHAVVVSPLTDFATVWMGELLRAMNLNQYSVSAAQPGLSVDAISALKIPVPPSAEQRTIADFLDRETAKLDTLMEKKRALIGKLKEKRAARMSCTVTRGLPPAAARAAGLNPHPKLKPSGVEWLGDVPEHWDVTAVGYQFRNLDHRRIPVAGEDRAIVEKTYPYYGASGIIDYVEDYLFDEPLILVAEDGANLLSRSTPLAFLATGKYWVNNHAHILKPVSGDIRYWVAVLQTHDYTPLVTGAAQPKLTSDRLSAIRIPLPSTNEQRAIADYLDRETAKIDRMVEKVEAVIERLREYRTALITAAVTGKIDVCGVRADNMSVTSGLTPSSHG